MLLSLEAASDIGRGASGMMQSPAIDDDEALEVGIHHSAVQENILQGRRALIANEERNEAVVLSEILSEYLHQ